MAKVLSYRRTPAGTQPDYFYPAYVSTCKRCPKQPLVLLPHTLSELTGPVFGHSDIGPDDSDDLTGIPPSKRNVTPPEVVAIGTSPMLAEIALVMKPMRLPFSATAEGTK